MSASRLARPPTRSPQVCGLCRQPFVQSEFGVQEGNRWRIFLRCGSCGWRGERVFDEKTLERFERELDADRHQICLDLERLTHRNMHEYQDRFVAALRADAILPEDF